MSHFKVGSVYNRRQDIHAIFGGQQQGGICTPKNANMVFIFTSESGERHGYEDRMQPDGIFWYYGEGQVGDMELSRGNIAVANHVEDGKELLLFEYVSKGHVRFVGECRCLGFRTEQAPDREGNPRQAIVFELEMCGESGPRGVVLPAEPKYWRVPLSDLDVMARRGADSAADVATRRVVSRRRSEAVRVLALRRADGVCEGCDAPAPFVDKTRKPFLEVHHLHRRADGGPDLPENVVAICPNCHRRVHQGEDGDDFNKQLIARRLDAING